MEEKVYLTMQELFCLINTLKSIEVTGFDSMDKLVGSVAFLNEVASRKEDSAE